MTPLRLVFQAAFALRHGLRAATRNLGDSRPARSSFGLAQYTVRD